MPLNRRAAKTKNTDSKDTAFDVENDDAKCKNNKSNSISLSQKRNAQKTQTSSRRRCEPRKGWQWCSSLFRKDTSLLILIILISLIILAVIHLFFREYSWVTQRCIYSKIAPTLHHRMECIEASVHRDAMYDEGLLWPVDSSRSFTLEQVDRFRKIRQQLQQGDDNNNKNDRTGAKNAVVKDVHFTLTSFFTNENVMDLARCTVEAASKHCAQLKEHHQQPCRINIWVVDEAASVYYNQISNTTDTSEQGEENAVDDPIYDLLSFLQKSESSNENKKDEYAPYCVRIIHPQNGNQRHHIGDACPSPTPSSSSSSSSPAKHMLEWLSTESSHNQISAHVSDAWRIVALKEVGGLYLDLDVAMMSNLLLYLPYKNVIPVQSRVGAYRMNGGLLKLDNGDDNSEGENDAWFGNFLRTSRRGETFLDALERDHLKWAPSLALQPKNRIDQKFGFLGPCALTRVYLSKQFDHSHEDDVLVLPEAVAEPMIGINVCKKVEDEQILAIHFSTTRKEGWKFSVKRDKCLKDLFGGICPRTMAKI